MYFHKVYTETLLLYSFFSVHVLGGKQCSLDSKSIFCTVFWVQMLLKILIAIFIVLLLHDTLWCILRACDTFVYWLCRM